MADIGRLLETMHPMREPPAPDAITPYLVLLGLGCALALGLLFAAWRARHRRNALRASAEAALAASRQLGPPERLAAQANLLRRLVRHLDGDEAARAQGEAWLARLDQAFATRFFTQGEGTVYGDALYRRPQKPDVGELNVDTLERALLGLIADVRPSPLRPSPDRPATQIQPARMRT